MLNRSSYKIITLSFILLVFCVSACDKPDTASSDGPPQQQSVSSPEAERPSYNDITQSTINGQGIQYYSAPFPLENLSLKELQTRVIEKNAAAMAELGRRYASGIGVTRNLAEAQKLYIEAAEADDMTAQNELAGAYDYGLFGETDQGKAVYWYQKAAEQNFPVAEVNLGKMYQEGGGVKQDYAVALSLYRSAAKKEFPPAQTLIGIFYEKGYGIEKNYQQAAYWYLLAAKQNYPIANYNLGSLYERGLGVDKNMLEAASYYEKAAIKNHELAQVNLGIMYLFGDISQPNYQKAYNLFKSSAQKGSLKFGGLFNIGQMYENGLFLGKNPVQAYAYYQVTLLLLRQKPTNSSTLNTHDVTDSITTLKAQMSASEIAAGEAEIPKVMQEYGIVL